MAYTTPEKKVQNKVIEILEGLQEEGVVRYFRRDAVGPNYKKGLPDLFFLVWGSSYGRHIEVECKAPGESLRSDQERWKRIFESLNIDHWVIDDIEDFKNKLSEVLSTLS